MKLRLLFFGVLLAGTMLCSCNNGGQLKKAASKKQPSVPSFNAQNAYAYIEKQLNFGPRVPNTPAQDSCADYLERVLRSFWPTVEVQETKVKAYDGTLLKCKNIIASYQPETNNRILLCAHWDSRPFADHDPDPENRNRPVPGANDGASGVGVLLEIARIVKQQQPKIGLDIILFDCEDYGKPIHLDKGSDANEYWALGSQYWARNPHKENYYARYGILLDMVGAKNAVFPKESYSMYYAAHIVNKVWKKAHTLGYGNVFLSQQAGLINDDHIYINEIMGIPTIDLIHLDPVTGSFFPQWHTVEDDIRQIDKATLKVVGQTLLELIYTEK